ncbi:MAG: pyruvate carboxylase, partial [Calditrichaeota bacterium]|nr:pyruvate carboxylase [Calditrichota bacterium]
MKKVLVANRGEIAIRIFRACTELGYQTVAIYTYEDRYSLHRYKADESYLIGKENESVRPYLDINEIIQLAKKINADAIHPGYGFLSENSKFVEACEKNGIQFVGPNSTVIGQLGNKVEAKIIAEKAGVPIIKGQHVNSFDDAKRACKETGYPVMLKAASGGGGRGMRVLQNESDLKNGFDSAKREALSAFGDDQVFIEKYIANPKHIEVQILGDQHGQIVHLYERDCSVQRRFQKVIEFAPSMTLDKTVQQRLYDYALKIAKAVNYSHAGTVEFLVENDEIYFVEVNPRIQVEHTVTELVTGVDLVKAQLLIAGGAKLADIGMNLHDQSAIPLNGFAIQCRITTEVPSEDFKPDFGKVMHYRSASGFGIRLDEGNIYNGAVISPFFDSMLVKISAWANTLEAASERMWRALMEFRVRGVKTNVQFLENVMRHPIFNEGKATVHFIKENPDLLNYRKRLDRGSKLLKYIAEVSVNGNPDVKKFDPDKTFFRPKVPDYNPYSDYPNGTKQLLDKLGPEKFSDWLREQKRVQITDTTFRDAHQSLIATRVRSYDILKVAESFAKAHPETFSLEMWGGATFDVAYRFLKEDPWKRLQRIRAAVPNILLQMLIRGSNAVGYTAYPDNLIERFIIKAAENGMDIFRIFDSLNWTEGMRFSIKTVREKTKSIAEACICYTGEVLNKSYQKYNLDYYLKLANELKSMGAHIIAIKDMAGLLKPYSAEYLISELKEKIDLPIHLHTHDTSSLQAATYMKAIESGVDAIDCALGGLSGLTSQPNFNSIVEMLKHTPHELDVNIHSLNAFSDYWATVREIYYPFESGLKSGAADVFYHEIPGGQYSNLQPQAISLGLGDRMPEIKKAYHDVNQLFGDIVKVTPSSKVVGDLALYLVSNGMSVDDIAAKGDSFPFPESVEGFFMGKIGQPHGGFPEAIQKQVLKGKIPFTDRPGAHLKAIDFSKEFEQFKQEFAADLSELDFISYKLYPKVFKDYFDFNSLYGDVDVLPSDIFFYGLRKDKEILIDIAPGKTLIVTLLSISDADD